MAPLTTWTPDNYPLTRRSDHVDVYESAANGQVAVPDPYCWLEKRTDEVEKWVAAQGLLARSYLDQNPDRQKFGDLLRSCMNYPRVTSAFPTTVRQRLRVISSSRPQLWSTMGDGTGTTIAGFNANRVSMLS